MSIRVGSIFFESPFFIPFYLFFRPFSLDFTSPKCYDNAVNKIFTVFL